MPRHRRRFSQLEKQFRDSGGVAEVGSRLEGYINFKKGVNKITVSKKLTAAERQRYGYAILPFGLSVPATPTAEDRYAAPITAYSDAGRKALELSNNELGYDDLVAATNQLDNFYPAIMHAFVRTPNTANTTPISGVTKKEYTRAPGVSYGIPFGRSVTASVDANTGAAETTVDDVDFEDMRVSLALQAKTGSATAKASSVSFEPEIFRIGKPDLKAAPPPV